MKGHKRRGVGWAGTCSNRLVFCQLTFSWVLNVSVHCVGFQAKSDMLTPAGGPGGGPGNRDTGGKPIGYASRCPSCRRRHSGWAAESGEKKEKGKRQLVDRLGLPGSLSRTQGADCCST